MATTILASWELGRAFGHVAHVAPLARGLRRRGIATVFAARDLINASSLPDQPFARIVQAPVYSHSPPPRPTLTYASAIADGGMADPDHATTLVAAWLQLFDLIKPDGLAAEFAPVSLLAAHVAGLRAVRTGSAWAVPPAVHPLPSLMPWLPDRPAARAAAGAVADDVVRIVCRRFGAPPLDGLAALLATAPRFLQSWPEFDHYGPDPDAVYYGPMSGLSASARPEWPQADGPQLFIYLPGEHAAAVPLAQAVGALGWPTLWYGTGQLPDLPANVLATGAPVDLDHVLQQAAIVAGRGGHATGCTALRHGCPQLIVPDTLETRLLGWRLQGRSLAAEMGEHPAPEELAAGLERLAADHRIAAAVATSAARYARYDARAAEDQLAHDVSAALGLV